MVRRRLSPVVAAALFSASALAGGGVVPLETRRPPERVPFETHPATAEDVVPPGRPSRPLDAHPPPSIVERPVVEPTTQAAPPREPEPNETDPFGASLRDGRVITGGTPHRLILFTFDDGPDLRYTGRLLDTLDALGIRAVFFLTARRFAGATPYERRLADLAREIVRRGHYVGSHTLDHLQLPLLTGPRLEEQVVGAEKVFESVLGARPFLIRPPGGSRSPRIDAFLARRGYTQMLWNLGTGDAQVRSSDEVLRTFARILERREREYGERGGIVLLHDIHAWSVEAVPRIVRWLEEKNCELLARGEELYDVVDDPRVFFVPRGEAAPGESAPPLEPDPVWLDARQAALRARTEARCHRLAMR